MNRLVWEIVAIHKVLRNIFNILILNHKKAFLLGGMVEKLQVLKRKADESISEELAASNVCKRRLEHLKEHAAIATSSSASTGTLNNNF